MWNDFFQMGFPAAVCLAVAAIASAGAITGFVMSRNARHARDLDHEEKMTALPLDAQARLADIQGKWAAPASAKRIEGRVE